MPAPMDRLNELLWGSGALPGPLTLGVLGLLLGGAGIYFTLRLRGVQFRKPGAFIDALRHSFRPDHADGVSSFRVFAVGLGGRIGAGNIVGVAIAITLGGPGAVFWMWMVALLGMATAVIENTLGQIYRRREQRDGEHVYRGGPAFYMQHGLRARWAGVIFSIVMIIAFPIGIVSVQSNTLATTVDAAFGVPPLLSGIIAAAVAGLVIFGGVRRITSFAEIVAPMMAVLYLAAGVVVVLLNISAVPTALADIVLGAFGLREAAGGAIGYAVSAGIVQGLRRGLFSNEAGMGSTPNIASAADVKHPAAQGLVQAVGVFIDTVVLCTVTALIILLGGVWQPGYSSATNGVTLTQDSLANVVGGWGSQFVAVCLVFFAFTTLLAVSYYGENAAWFLQKDRRLIWAVRALVIVVTVVSSVAAATDVWNLADATIGVLAVLNLLAVMLLAPKAVRVVKDYFAQRAEGREPEFDPAAFPEFDLDADDWAQPVSSPRTAGPSLR
ncbi:MAG: alanine/glycine:cation symporter family protein [Actinomycetota bacterium]